MSEADISGYQLDCHRQEKTSSGIFMLTVSLLKRRQKEGAGRRNQEGISSLLNWTNGPSKNHYACRRKEAETESIISPSHLRRQEAPSMEAAFVTYYD